MKKVYLIWILPQAAKKRDGQVSICKTDEKKHLEKLESYDKREQIVIYLDKEHDTSKKYQEYDEILTPLVVFLNNILDYQGKIRIMKEYGFKEIEKEVREVCDYANILEKEYLNNAVLLYRFFSAGGGGGGGTVGKRKTKMPIWMMIKYY